MPESIHDAAQRLRVGGLVAFATETVYGLGAHALDPDAVARIFAVKGRPATNPLIVHVADAESARVLVRWADDAEALARAFWPGPLSLVLPRREAVPDIVTARLETVAVRVPAHPLALDLLRVAQIPIAAPSANRSESLSPTRAEHVRASLGDFLDPARDAILDGGPCEVGIESTVLDLSRGAPILLRPGGVSRARIEAVVGPIQLAHEQVIADASARPSPGMSARHYAPRARAVRFESREQIERALRAPVLPARLGVVALRAIAESGAMVQVLSGEPAGYASAIYQTLHQMDEAQCQEIWIEMPPATEEWRAVRDRLRRATVAAPG